MFIRQSGDGNWYMCRTSTKKSGASKSTTKKSYRNWFLIKNNSSSPGGVITINSIIFPQEFAGKRIRLKVEII